MRDRREKGRLLTSIMDLVVHLAKRFKDCVEREGIVRERARPRQCAIARRRGRIVAVVYFQSSRDRPGKRIIEHTAW